MDNYEHLSLGRKTIIGIQFLFVAFGATVLVPLLVGMDPSTALLTAGIGTLLFHLVTKGKVPIFLGSSFAFIAPIIQASKLYGLSGAIFGLIGVSCVYLLVSALVKWQGVKVIQKLFPPVVIGPVIILIGLSLSGVGVKMAENNWWLAIISLSTAIAVTIFGRGLIKLIPIFCGIIVGYIVALCFNEVDLSKVIAANWIGLPPITLPNKIVWQAIIFMIPVAIAPVIEHIGDVYVVNTVARKDFVKDPGLHRTLLGDGLACLIAACLSGPPVTTYSEVTGAMALTKVTDPFAIRISAITAILFAFVGKISALLQSIPQAVLGGIMLLLFGTIANAGIMNLIQHDIDLRNTKNIVIVSVTLTMGIGGAAINWGTFSLSGIGLSAVVAVLLNLILPNEKVTKTEKN